MGSAVAHEHKSSAIGGSSGGVIITSGGNSLGGDGSGNSFLISVDFGSVSANFAQQGLSNGNAFELIRVLVHSFAHFVVLSAVHQVSRLNNQVLNAVGNSAVQSLLHVINFLAIAGLHMVDDDLCGESAADGPIRVSGLQGILDALDICRAAAVEGGAKADDQQFVFADLIPIAGIVQVGIAGIAAKVVGVSVLAFHQLFLGIGQGVPCLLGSFALGIGVIGALLHIDGIDQVCNVFCGQFVSLLAGNLAAGSRSCRAGSSGAACGTAAAGQYTGAQSQSGQSGRRFADVAFFHLAFPFLMWVKYGAEQKGTGKRSCKNGAFCLRNGKAKRPRILQAFWYNQFLVIWGGKAPVPTAGRFPDSKLNARCRLPKPDGSVTGAKAP